MALRVLHLCLPNDDNLGDALAHQVLDPWLLAQGLDAEIHKVDLWELRTRGVGLDDRLGEINASFDLVVLGAGGLLSPGLLPCVFRNPGCWKRLAPPLVLWGVGLIANRGQPSAFTHMQPNHPVALAVAAASLVGVRDLRSWLFASRFVRDPDHLFLTGCPTLTWLTMEAPAEPTYDLGLNLPLAHGVTAEHTEALLKVAAFLLSQLPNTAWICHSAAEVKQAELVRERLGLDLAIMAPTAADDVRRVYGSCRYGLATKMHAGLFFLAAGVPFGMLSYDIKCHALMEMLVDFPDRYLLAVDGLAGPGLDRRVWAVLQAVERDADALGAARRALLDRFAGGWARFAVRLSGMLPAATSPAPSALPCSL